MEERTADLSAASQQVRAEAKKMLVAEGPKALPILVRFMRQHLADKDETAWRTTYETMEAIVRQYSEDQHLDDALLKMEPPDTKNATFGGIDFVWIPEGWFVAGTSFDSAGYSDSPPDYRGEIRRVRLDGFWISRTELKWRDLKALEVEVAPQLRCEKGDDGPLHSLRMADVQKVCDKLSLAVKDSGLVATIPTNDQWEKAARGTDGRLYVWGNSRTRGIESIGGRRENGIGPRPCGSYAMDTSPYGVKDLVGNVAERTRDDKTGLVPKGQLTDIPPAQLWVRGTGFRLDYDHEPMCAYKTRAFPVGVRIVLVPAAAAQADAGKGPDGEKKPLF